MKIDLHVHTYFSGDNKSDPEKIVRVAKTRGLDGIAITDHDTCNGWPVMKELCKKQGLKLVLGEEVTLAEGGHALCLFLKKPVKSIYLKEVHDEVARQGGLVIAAHPFVVARIPFNELEERVEHLDGIEGLNAKCWTNKPNQKAQEFARKRGLPVTAGSDAHVPLEVGVAYTEANVSSIDAFKKAILGRNVMLRGSLVNPVRHLHTRIRNLRV